MRSETYLQSTQPETEHAGLQMESSADSAGRGQNTTAGTTTAVHE